MATIDPRLAGLLGGGGSATIDPRVLQALASGQDIGQYGYSSSMYQPQKWDPSSGQGQDQAYMPNGDPMQLLYQDIGNNKTNVFDAQGNYLGPSSGDSDSRNLFNFIALSAAMYGGANALAGAGGGGAAGGGAASGGGGAAAAGGGTGAGGSITGLTAAELGAGVAAPTAAEVGALMPSLGAGGAAAGGAAGGLLGAGGGGAGGGAGAGAMSGMDLAADAGAGAIGSGGSMASGGGSLLGLDYSTWAKLIGAGIGAASSGDQEQKSTQNREPWGPAQDWIKQNIASGQALQQQYQQQPFSQTQQGAYSNQFGLLNSANQNMPAWMQGMQANASGANNYDRRNPQRGLLGAGQTTTPQFGLLNPSFKVGG